MSLLIVKTGKLIVVEIRKLVFSAFEHQGCHDCFTYSVHSSLTYSMTLTVFLHRNLQGNAISDIGKDTWKSYHLVEKL